MYFLNVPLCPYSNWYCLGGSPYWANAIEKEVIRAGFGFTISKIVKQNKKALKAVVGVMFTNDI